MTETEEIQSLIDRDDAPLEQAIARQRLMTTPPQRTFIARMIILFYIVFILAFLLYLFARSFALGMDVSDQVAELLKIAVLPIVTLMIGYYFGSTER